MNVNPPKRALKFLRWFCREDYIEELEGDLTEIFRKEYGIAPARAKRKFVWSVIRYFRPEFIKSFTANRYINTLPMFWHNFLITLRNHKKHKASFLLNLTGLSTGLACAIMIYLWVNDELSVDKFHENDTRLYQVMKTVPRADGTVTTMVYTPAQMAQEMVKDLPEVELAVSVISHGETGIVSAGEKGVKAKHQFADKDYFRVFSYPLLEGNKYKVLTGKHEVLLSDKLAMKLFNTTENLIGKSIEWQWRDKFDGPYTVSGLFEARSSRSSAQFDIIFSLSAWESNNDNCWCSNNANTYLVLREGTAIEEFNEKIRDYSKVKLNALEGPGGLKWEGTLFAQRFSERYLHGIYENGFVSGGKIEYVALFSIIGIAILVIACINFMNLSTAKASRRMKEVGIKKVIGAHRWALILQYIGESMFMTFLSLAIAIFMVYILLPPFRTITGKDIALNFDYNLLLALGLITLITGIISGSYPAFHLSGFRPTDVLKGRIKATTSESWVRKGLVVFQFSVSVVLIVSVIVILKQIEFIQTKNLGYDRNNIIRISNEGKLEKSLTPFLNQIKTIPGVLGASGMSGDFTGNHSGGGGIQWPGKDPNHGIEFSGLYVDYNVIEMLNLKMAEGRSFSPDPGSDNEKVIFNETAVAMMNLKDPIGQTVTMWGREKKIVGVVKNFHYESLYERVGPLFLCYGEKHQSTLIKIKSGMEAETLHQIGAVYNDYNNGLPFEYQFLDQDFQVLYAAENRVALLSKYFASIAILISCLGLFGLAAFTAERRTREIGIRKILGSNELNIVYLLSGDFTKIILTAITVGLFVGYLITKTWLESFAYRISLEWWFFAGAGVAALIISWITIGIHTIKAARTNPIETLKMDQ